MDLFFLFDDFHRLFCFCFVPKFFFGSLFRHHHHRRHDCCLFVWKSKKKKKKHFGSLAARWAIIDCHPILNCNRIKNQIGHSDTGFWIYIQYIICCRWSLLFVFLLFTIVYHYYIKNNLHICKVCAIMNDNHQIGSSLDCLLIVCCCYFCIIWYYVWSILIAVVVVFFWFWILDYLIIIVMFRIKNIIIIASDLESSWSWSCWNSIITNQDFFSLTFIQRMNQA